MDVYGVELSVAVLTNKVRVILPLTHNDNLEGDLVAKHDKIISQIPLFLEQTSSIHAKELKPFISAQELKNAEVSFIDKDGTEATGYDALILALISEAYLENRDAARKAHGDDYKMPEHIETATHFAQLLMVNLAMIGMTALIDESTGYQDVRAKDALQRQLKDSIKSAKNPKQEPVIEEVK